MQAKHALAVIISILSMGAVADASLIRFDVSSTCLSRCSGIGLDAGDEVGGYFILDSSLFDDFFGYGPDALVDFSMTLGTLSLDMSSAAGAFFAAEGPSNATDQLTDGWRLNASTVIFPSYGSDGATGTGISLKGGSASSASFSTKCINDACNYFTLVSSVKIDEFGPASGTPHVVPLPAGGLIMLSGVAALAVGAGRRKKRRA